MWTTGMSSKINRKTGFYRISEPIYSFNMNYNRKKRTLMTIFVLSKDGKRLMPTIRPGKVRHLLKDGKAKIISHQPFTIQLLYDTTGYTQPIEFCEDTGDRYIGISIKSEKQEYVSQEVLPLADEKQKHDAQRKNRRNRRGRRRYRKNRFDNRQREEGWIAPSIEHKKEVNLAWYRKYLNVCPITNAAFETGQFDTQKLQAIEGGSILPEGKDYQQGPRYNTATLREAVFVRDHYTCVFCGRSVKDKAVLHVHHALYWKGRHGSQVNELATACERCHTPANHAKDGLLWGYTPGTFVAMGGAATMNILRHRIVKEAKALDEHVQVSVTYGADTKAMRQFMGLEKSHVNDAYVMGNLHPEERAVYIRYKKKRRNNRILEDFYDASYVDSRDGSIKNGKELYNGRTKRNKNRNTENLHKYRRRKVTNGRRAMKRKTVSLRPGDIVSLNRETLVVHGTHTSKKGSVNVQFTKPARNGRKSADLKKLKILGQRFNSGWEQVV